MVFEVALEAEQTVKVKRVLDRHCRLRERVRHQSGGVALDGRGKCGDGTTRVKKNATTQMLLPDS